MNCNSRKATVPGYEAQFEEGENILVLLFSGPGATGPIPVLGRAQIT